MEEQIGKTKGNVEEDELSRRHVQENYSQRLFAVQSKTEKMREQLRISEGIL